MTNLPNQTLTFELYLSELEKEVTKMQRATDYRKTTAEMALRVVKFFRDVTLFETREKAYKTLKSYYVNEDEDRLLDVSKFLNVLFKHLEKWSNLPEHVLAKLHEKSKMRKQLTLEPVM